MTLNATDIILNDDLDCNYMNINEFKKSREKGREELSNKMTEIFKHYDPVAIHQFGSGVTGYKDVFSDLDFWITFQNGQVKEMVEKVFWI